MKASEPPPPHGGNCMTTATPGVGKEDAPYYSHAIENMCGGSSEAAHSTKWWATLPLAPPLLLMLPPRAVTWREANFGYV
jgi:hypothetical protein